MSLWDWLLAAWIYEELFDDDSDTPSHDNTCDYDRHMTSMIMRRIIDTNSVCFQ